MVVFISCTNNNQQKKDSVNDNAIPILNFDTISFMGIGIGSRVDSLMQILEKNKDVTFESDNYYPEAFVYPDYDNLDDREKLIFTDFDLGKYEGCFYTNIYAKPHGESRTLPVKVYVYSRDNKVVRLICTADYSKDISWTDFVDLYDKKYGSVVNPIRSYKDFVFEQKANLDEHKTLYFWGVMYKFKKNKRIFLVEYDPTKLNPSKICKDVFIVYEDATDYYNYLKDMKAKKKKIRANKLKQQKDYENNVNEKIKEQDI